MASRPALPLFLVAIISFALAIVTGLDWLGKPLRLVQLVTMIGLGMTVGVSWAQAVQRARAARTSRAEHPSLRSG